MAGSLRFAKFLFLLFFFQDVGNIVLLKLDASNAIQAFSSIKELVIVLLLGHHWLRATPTREMRPQSVLLVLLLALFFTLGSWRGIMQFPLDGVIFELRTLVLPILVFFWGRAFVEAAPRASERTEALVRFYVKVCVFFALSALVDYAFIGEDFWVWVDIGSVSRAKGYVATSSGALPDNMYSFFFGRRAFGLAFNPLNLAYVLIPAMLFSYYRRQFVRLAVTALAFILSFSRLPALAMVAVLSLMAIPKAIRGIFIILGGIGVAIAVYLLRGLLFADPSASEHFADIPLGFLQQLVNPVGEGIGAAGVYAGNYSRLSLESAMLNTANQISVVGLLAYVWLFARGLGMEGALGREMRIMAAVYAITAIFAPQILVIKSTFAFFFFMGCNAALADNAVRAMDRGRAHPAVGMKQGRA